MVSAPSPPIIVSAPESELRLSSSSPPFIVVGRDAARRLDAKSSPSRRSSRIEVNAAGSHAATLAMTCTQVAPAT